MVSHAFGQLRPRLLLQAAQLTKMRQKEKAENTQTVRDAQEAGAGCSKSLADRSIRSLPVRILRMSLTTWQNMLLVHRASDETRPQSSERAS